jgi:hypothetical protein
MTRESSRFQRLSLTDRFDRKVKPRDFKKFKTEVQLNLEVRERMEGVATV